MSDKLLSWIQAVVVVLLAAYVASNSAREAKNEDRLDGVIQASMRNEVRISTLLEEKRATGTELATDLKSLRAEVAQIRVQLSRVETKLEGK